MNRELSVRRDWRRAGSKPLCGSLDLDHRDAIWDHTGGDGAGQCDSAVSDACQLYWNVIQLPIATYGLIGSGMALLGLFVPKIARWMSEHNSAVKNFSIHRRRLFVGLGGAGFAVPYWGIVPAVLLYVAFN